DDLAPILTHEKVAQRGRARKASPVRAEDAAVALDQGRIPGEDGPGRRRGAASSANSQSSGRVSRGSMISSIQNVSAERKGERSLLSRVSISAIFARGSSAASMSAR